MKKALDFFYTLLLAALGLFFLYTLCFGQPDPLSGPPRRVAPTMQP